MNFWIYKLGFLFCDKALPRRPSSSHPSHLIQEFARLTGANLPTSSHLISRFLPPLAPLHRTPPALSLRHFRRHHLSFCSLLCLRFPHPIFHHRLSFLVPDKVRFINSHGDNYSLIYTPSPKRRLWIILGSS